MLQSPNVNNITREEALTAEYKQWVAFSSKLII